MSARSPLHRYEEIAEGIRKDVLNGLYWEDRRLPSERNLGIQYAAQRTTIRQSLNLLEREGIVSSVGKSGWFVSSTAPVRRPISNTGRRVLFVTFRRGTGPAIEALSSGIQSAFAGEGIQLLRYDPDDQTEGENISNVEQLKSVDAAGIVMWPYSSVERRLLRAVQDHTPLVLVDRTVFGFECDSVLFDDLGGGRLVTEHLIANGHRRIAFFGDEPFAESVQSRWQGYRLALEAAGITPNENYTVLPRGRAEPTFSATIRILLHELEHRPTAIVCANDGVASELLLMLRSQGLRVPEDIAVTGFGDQNPEYFDVMELTSVHQPFHDMGIAAGQMLRRRLAEPVGPRTSRPEEIWVPMSLSARRSSSKPSEPSGPSEPLSPLGEKGQG